MLSANYRYKGVKILENSGQVTAILRFWFGDDRNNPDWVEDNRRWYSGGEVFDNLIREQFSLQVEQALAGGLDDWAQSPDSAMALILLLDQFTRNIFRGSPRAFEGDEQARLFLETVLDRGFVRSMSFKERCFLYMPLEHSESLEDQQKCVALFEALLAEVPLEYKTNIASSLAFAVKHRDIILKFGRFPHRNQILGRDSTVKELQYLSKGGARFGQ